MGGLMRSSFDALYTDEPMTERCDGCRFARCVTRQVEPTVARESWECRLNPPTGSRLPWPTVEADDWCQRWAAQRGSGGAGLLP